MPCFFLYFSAIFINFCAFKQLTSGHLKIVYNKWDIKIKALFHLDLASKFLC